MFERRFAAATVAAVALVAGSASAQQTADFPSFDEVDGNLNGAISQEEFARAFPEVENPDQLFAQADTGGDGLVWREEWAAWREQRIGAGGVTGAAAAATDGADADDGWLESGASIEVAVTGEELQGRFQTDADLVGLPGNRVGFGLLFTDDRDIVGSAELMAPGLLESFLPGFIRISLGGKALIGMLDDPDDESFGFLPGAEARVRLPVSQTVPMFVVGNIFFAPDILTFGDADEIIDFDIRYEVQFLEQTTGFVGYRVLNFEREDGGDDKIVNGLQAGLRFTF